MSNEIIEFIEICNSKPVDEVIKILEGTDLTLIISGGYVTGIAVDEFEVQA